MPETVPTRVRRRWPLAVVLGVLALSALALEVPPAPLGRVSDFAGLLRPSDEQRIENRLEAIEKADSNQFVVAIFKSLQGDSLEDFSIRLADAWKVGHKGRDNGLILLIFTEDRKVRIEVGYGLEGAITDALSGRVIRDVLAPRFRQGDYAGGILAAVDALDAASRGEFKPLPDRKGGKGGVPAPVAGALPFLLFFLFLVIAAARNRAAHLGSRSRRRHPGGFWWIGPGGFGGGGFGGFGGGGGGFSGGGGGFGGGGASGGW